MKIIILILCCFITACSGSIYRSANLKIRSSNTLNLTNNNQATSIRLHIYQLSKPYPFKMLSYADLESSPFKLLGDSLADKTDYIIWPDSSFKKQISIMAGVRFIAVVAGYHSEKNNRWKALIAIPRPAMPWLSYLGFYQHLNLNIDLRTHSVLVKL